MDKQQFDLNDEARNKINEQYEYADERVSASKGESRLRPRKKTAVPKKESPKPRTQAVRKAPLRKESSRPAPAPVIRSAPPQRPPMPENRPAPPAEEPVENTKRSRFLRFYKRFAIVISILGVIYIALNIGFLYFRGQLWFNEPRKRDYPVRGAVVSSELGAMDWAEFQYQPITFAYVRATRGTNFTDEQYSANREGIDGSKLWAGFYHEFDFSAGGEKQAEHYINTVGDLDGELRPAVKLTAYGAYKIRMKSAEKVKTELDAFLKRIKNEYGRRAVLICDNDCYKKYIRQYYSDQTLWLIDHFSEPDEKAEWAIWEYNPRVRSAGYENKDEYYSMVVYRLGKDIANFRKNFEIGYES